MTNIIDTATRNLDIRAAQTALGITDATKPANDPCCLCGRHVKAPGALLMCVAGGLDLAAPLAEEDERAASDNGFMGLQPVGSDCARKLRKLLGAQADAYLAKPA